MKDKEAKAWHITYDVDEENYNEDLYKQKFTGLYVETKPYYLVFEIGKTGKWHHHFYFYSKLCKNNLKKKFEAITLEPVYFSDPDSLKYTKYDADGVKGVEIYLHKGVTNHMSKNDDLDVTPCAILYNKAYYDRKTEGHYGKGETWSQFCRNKYEASVTSMKEWKQEVAKQTKERQQTEIQVILKDLQNYPSYSRSEILDYLAYTHFVKPEYTFSETRAKSLFWKILKEKSPNEYKNDMRQKLDRICVPL